MSLDFYLISLDIFWPVLVIGAGAGGVFLATIAIVEGMNRLLARFRSK